MAFNTTSLAKARELYERATLKVKKINEEHSSSIGEVFRAGEVVAAASAMGFINGRFGGAEGEVQVMGIPVDLTLGAVLHAAAFTKMIPEQYRAHGHNLGSGILAAGAYRQLASVGQKSRERALAAQHPQAQVQGYPQPPQLAQNAPVPPWAGQPWAAAPLAQVPPAAPAPAGAARPGT